MQEIAISEFKAKCLSILDEVNKTKKPIRILRRGKPVAEIVPPHASAQATKIGPYGWNCEDFGGHCFSNH